MDEEYYQLIIVDDEEQARRSLAKYLDWHQLGFHVAATLEDGSDAIAYPGWNWPSGCRPSAAISGW